MLRIIKWSIGCAVFLVLVSFALINRQLVSIDLFPLPLLIDVPLFLVIFASAMAGCLLAALLGLYTHAKFLARHMHYKQKIHALENEIKGLHADVELRKD